MNSSRLLPVSLWLTFLFPLSLLGESYVALASKGFQASYPIDVESVKLYPSEKYPICSETPDAYFILYNFGEQTHVVELPKQQKGRSIAY